MPSYPLPRTTLALTTSLSAILALSACGGGSSSSSHSGASSAAHAAHASTDPNAPVLSPGHPVSANLSSLPSDTPGVVVPGIDGSQWNLTSTAPTSGTLTGVLGPDGKARTAPQGYDLVAVGVNEKGAAPSFDGTATTHEPPATPMTVTLLAGSTTIPVGTMNTSTGNGPMTGWIVAVPAKDASNVKVKLTIAGGSQVVAAGSSTRDDALSNGLPVTASIKAPVTSTTACDNGPTPTNGIPAGMTLSGPLTCGLAWQLTDHLDSIGWAPPGKAWLVAHAVFNQPPGVMPANSGIGYTTPTHLTGTASLGSIPATKVIAGGQSLGQSLTSVFPVTATTSDLTKLTVHASWDAQAQIDPPPSGMPESVHVTIPATATAAPSAAGTTISYTVQGATP